MNILFILHGWQSSKEKWQKVKKELEFFKEPGSLKVIVPDLPGFKPENALKEPWTLDNYVQWFLSKACGEIAEPFFLLGHSFGGRLAIKFAAKYPEKLKGLILVSAAGIRRETFQKKFWGKIAKMVKKAKGDPTSAEGGGRVSAVLRKFFYRFILCKTDYLQVSGALKETFKNVIGEDLTPLLGKISVPTLIVWGKKDKMTPLKDAFLMKEKIPNARLELIPKAGHRLNIEAPEILAQKVKNFLSSDL